MLFENLSSDKNDEFWYNLSTGEVEQGQQSKITELWGPFKTREEASQAMAKAKARNEELDAEKDSWL